jgi:phosphatidylserine decarboxylase
MTDFLFPKIHKEGYRFIATGVIATIIFFIISNFLGIISLLVTIWIYYFFRDPERYSIKDESYLISPADGIISQIVETTGPKELGLEDKKFTRVSIFMNVFNCHVNRSPCSGKITEIDYVPGKFINASLDKASEDNERNYIKIKKTNEDQIIIVQIAGLIARRIICEVNDKDEIQQGERVGIIRFGSRVDLYFENYKLLVQQNQKTVSGETLIAKKL